MAVWPEPRTSHIESPAPAAAANARTGLRPPRSPSNGWRVATGGMWSAVVSSANGAAVSVRCAGDADASVPRASGADPSLPRAGARPSVALVHDYLLVMRGAERTFATLAECWPDAPIYTLLYDPEGTEQRFSRRVVETSPLQRLGVSQRGFRRLLPLFPWAVEQLPLEGYDVVISSSSAFAHGIRPGEDTLHVSYCHTPFRYVWHEHARALAEMPSALRPIAKPVLRGMRRWDVQASHRVSDYIANSELCRERLMRCYGRRARIVHPPVDIDRHHAGASGDYLLIVGEIVKHKRVHIALEAARRAHRRIKVVGDGPERQRLAAAYGSSAEFLGRVSDEELNELYGSALALVVPNVEEFGITAVEAQAAGRPVLAVNAGGARVTVVPGVTGVLVPPDDVDALATAMRETDFDSFDPHAIRAHATRFSPEAFKGRLRAEVSFLTGGRIPPPVLAGDGDTARTNGSPAVPPREVHLRPADVALDD